MPVEAFLIISATCNLGPKISQFCIKKSSVTIDLRLEVAPLPILAAP